MCQRARMRIARHAYTYHTNINIDMPAYPYADAYAYPYADSYAYSYAYTYTYASRVLMLHRQADPSSRRVAAGDRAADAYVLWVLCVWSILCVFCVLCVWSMLCVC
jgi:hypothetical protein